MSNPDDVILKVGTDIPAPDGTGGYRIVKEILPYKKLTSEVLEAYGQQPKLAVIGLTPNFPDWLVPALLKMEAEASE